MILWVPVEDGTGQEQGEAFDEDYRV
jgi:hypothetical protein